MSLLELHVAEGSRAHFLFSSRFCSVPRPPPQHLQLPWGTGEDSLRCVTLHPGVVSHHRAAPRPPRASPAAGSLPRRPCRPSLAGARVQVPDFQSGTERAHKAWGFSAGRQLSGSPPANPTNSKSWKARSPCPRNSEEIFTLQRSVEPVNETAWPSRLPAASQRRQGGRPPSPGCVGLRNPRAASSAISLLGVCSLFKQPEKCSTTSAPPRITEDQPPPSSPEPPIYTSVTGSAELCGLELKP